MPPSLKGALVRETARRGGSLNDTATMLLAERFGVPFTDADNGIVETFGQRSQTPTLHYGLRFWVIPNRFQIDAQRPNRSGIGIPTSSGP